MNYRVVNEPIVIERAKRQKSLMIRHSVLIGRFVDNNAGLVYI